MAGSQVEIYGTTFPNVLTEHELNTELSKHCMLCGISLNNNEYSVYQTSCQPPHLFHLSCLSSKWNSGSESCPKCETDLSASAESVQLLASSDPHIRRPSAKWQEMKACVRKSQAASSSPVPYEGNMVYFRNRVVQLKSELENDPRRHQNKFEWAVVVSKEITKLRKISGAHTEEDFKERTECLRAQLASLYLEPLPEFISYCQRMVDRQLGRNIAKEINSVMFQIYLIFKMSQMETHLRPQIQRLYQIFIRKELDYLSFTKCLSSQVDDRKPHGVAKMLDESISWTSNALGWVLADTGPAVSFRLVPADELKDAKKTHEQLSRGKSRSSFSQSDQQRWGMTKNLKQEAKAQHLDQLEKLCWSSTPENPMLQRLLQDFLRVQVSKYLVQKDKPRNFISSRATLKALDLLLTQHPNSMEKLPFIKKDMQILLSSIVKQLILHAQLITIPKSERRYEQIIPKLISGRWLDEPTVKMWSELQHSSQQSSQRTGLHRLKTNAVKESALITKAKVAQQCDQFEMLFKAREKATGELKQRKSGEVLAVLKKLIDNLDTIRTFKDGGVLELRVDRCRQKLYEDTFCRIFGIAGRWLPHGVRKPDFTQVAAELAKEKGAIVCYQGFIYVLKSEQQKNWRLTVCKAWLPVLDGIKTAEKIGPEHLQELNNLYKVSPDIPCKQTWDKTIKTLQHVFYVLALRKNSAMAAAQDMNPKLSGLLKWSNELVKQAKTDIDREEVKKLNENIQKFEYEQKKFELEQLKAQKQHQASGKPKAEHQSQVTMVKTKMSEPVHQASSQSARQKVAESSSKVKDESKKVLARQTASVAKTSRSSAHQTAVVHSQSHVQQERASSQSQLRSDTNKVTMESQSEENRQLKTATGHEVEVKTSRKRHFQVQSSPDRSQMHMQHMQQMHQTHVQFAPVAPSHQTLNPPLAIDFPQGASYAGGFSPFPPAVLSLPQTLATQPMPLPSAMQLSQGMMMSNSQQVFNFGGQQYLLMQQSVMQLAQQQMLVPISAGGIVPSNYFSDDFMQYQQMTQETDSLDQEIHTGAIVKLQDAVNLFRINGFSESHNVNTLCSEGVNELFLAIERYCDVESIYNKTDQNELRLLLAHFQHVLARITSDIYQEEINDLCQSLANSMIINCNVNGCKFFFEIAILLTRIREGFGLGDIAGRSPYEYHFDAQFQPAVKMLTYE